MSFNIAVAGKGGTGKTSISGMLIRYLLEKKNGPILAVDADANMNLNEVIARRGALDDALYVIERGAVDLKALLPGQELLVRPAGPTPTPPCSRSALCPTRPVRSPRAAAWPPRGARGRPG